MFDDFSDEAIDWANKVSMYMLELAEQYEERYMDVEDGVPFGDLAYAKALADWHKNGRPILAFFSYAEGEKACPVLMEFRKEISKKFGLEIFTQEEAVERRKLYSNIQTVKVTDWGVN